MESSLVQILCQTQKNCCCHRREERKESGLSTPTESTAGPTAAPQSAPAIYFTNYFHQSAAMPKN